MRKIRRIVKREDVRELLETAGFTFVTVKFIKKNGEDRTLNGRLHVRKHLHGGKSTVQNHKNLITFYDVHKQGYRNVNLDTLYEVKVLGRTYEVI